MTYKRRDDDTHMMTMDQASIDRFRLDPGEREPTARTVMCHPLEAGHEPSADRFIETPSLVGRVRVAVTTEVR